MRQFIARARTLSVAIILLGASLAGCADPTAFLPKPYQPQDKGRNYIAAMILPDHIVVPLVRGLDEETAALVTRAVIDDFLQKETIATALAPAQKTSRLYGEFIARPGRVSTIRWTFLDPRGATLDDFEVPVPGDLLDQDAGSLIAGIHASDIATATTTRILGLNRRPERTRANNIGATGARDETIIVTAIFGTSGDGGRRLRTGIINALGEAGFTVANRPGDKTFYLQCTVGLADSQNGVQRLALTWELKSPQGSVLATIDQANDIPAGSLKEGWANLVSPVTHGAATGISAYFQNREEN